ncbi:hypothetical protein M3172_04005 [Mesobacillus subterraneus]|uniref:hypothetical protein n=1 Tax=Mesobacillus subterraneus TaxID=285983 RepID=UPI0020419174|nr:hypothetical protein [Mesobacillus subterraneus]MCM3572340.1 hypothetical protein [Mesobacillus subterraneus]
MNTIIRWVIAVILFLFAVLLFSKGLDLRSFGTNVDGEGIGVYFFAMEINDRVPEEEIPSYANGFFISSFVVFIISVLFVWVNLKLKNKASME